MLFGWPESAGCLWEAQVNAALSPAQQRHLEALRTLAEGEGERDGSPCGLMVKYQ